MTAVALRASRWRTGRLAARRLAGRVRRAPRLRPAYLIVGAKRGGTTSLHEYLLAHPDVLAANVAKGTRYFDVHHAKGWRWYESHFPLARAADKHERRTGRRPIVGEASPYYSFHPLAPARIAAELPGVRLILVARNPVERAWSHYRYEVARGFEKLDLHAALDAEDERLAGEEARLERDDGYVSFAHRHFSYVQRGLYAAHLRRMYEHIPRDDVLVVSSEALYGDTPATLGVVADFLGLEAAPYVTRTIHKANEDGDLPDTARRRLEARFHDANLELFDLLGTRFPW